MQHCGLNQTLLYDAWRVNKKHNNIYKLQHKIHKLNIYLYSHIYKYIASFLYIYTYIFVKKYVKKSSIE